MNPPTVAGLQAAATYLANLEPDFSRMDVQERIESLVALDAIDKPLRLLKDELGFLECPCCGKPVGERVLHEL